MPPPQNTPNAVADDRAGGEGAGIAPKCPAEAASAAAAAAAAAAPPQIGNCRCGSCLKESKGLMVGARGGHRCIKAGRDAGRDDDDERDGGADDRGGARRGVARWKTRAPPTAPTTLH